MGGARRAGQSGMTTAIQKAIRMEKHLAVQAGTGTGKSMAYLIPAIAHAVETNTSIIVSTATIALQRQLISRDLPRLATALQPELGDITFAILKGRSNYLCLNKLSVDDEDSALIDPAHISRLGHQIQHLHDWASDSDDGDRDSLDSGVSDLAWKQVSVTAQECIGASRCPHGDDCFAERARDRARGAHIVVTNHALLAIDALSDGNILPEHNIVIIDEAHELDGRITSVATEELAAPGMRATARRVAKFDDEASSSLMNSIDDWQRYIDTVIDDGRWKPVPDNATTNVEDLRQHLNTAFTAVHSVSPDTLTANPEKAAERQAVLSALDDLQDTCTRILSYANQLSQQQNGVSDEPDDVVWKENGDPGKVLVAPLSVAPLLSKNLFSTSTVILTSATLALGGKFDAMAAQWGLPTNTYTTLDVGTPFDARRSGILYVADHLQPPGRDGMSSEACEEMRTLISAAGGRTLGLFSSRRAAEAAADAMRSVLPFDVYCQGDDSLSALVTAFSNNENSVLFGTLSLWQGVDVPGPSLSLVIIDRIPFPRPDDPLLKARSDAADAAGRSGFMEVSATHAALLMAQGAGRLLRSVDDRGVVAVLDSRLATKRYGSYIAASMPDLWRTNSLHQTQAALQRLVKKGDS
ncbi:ATP-dependent DNA helicase [Corynebacterium kroppenstedtii]|uniref:ATP-dependent DNA helicase n=1 Tax=Corynebacterium sp. PCR 32 TaxID=3351342 RepID=UPI0030AA7828